MRSLVLALCIFSGAASSAMAQVSVNIGITLPGVNIGINVPQYPRMVRVPDYPVYYAPSLQLNFFFYDGLYWVYHHDDWYASSWYNGPWNRVGPEVVPLFVLRIPVRYYQQPPQYFRDWARNEPPRWGQHWGPAWQQQRGTWDRWDRRAIPRPAPLPVYQRAYSGNRYPDAERQRSLRVEKYRHVPRETVVREYNRQRSAGRTPAPIERTAPVQRAAPEERTAPVQRAVPEERTAPVQRAAPEERAAPGQRATPDDRTPRNSQTREKSSPRQEQDRERSTSRVPDQRERPAERTADKVPDRAPPAAKAETATQKAVPPERGKRSEARQEKGQNRSRNERDKDEKPDGKGAR